jgi:Putative manganese efflux pump
VGSGREQARDVMALKSMRRFRVFRPAIALVYRSQKAPDLLVDIAVDGYPSEPHSLAFAEAGLVKKLGLSDGVERAEDHIAPVVGQHVAKILRNEERNQRMRELKRAMRAETPTPAPPGDEPSDAEVQVDEEAKKRATRAREIAMTRSGSGVSWSVRGWAAPVLGLTVSLDELAIGFTLGLWGLPIGAVVALIGVQALIFSQVGLRLGSRLSDRVRESAERLAGLVLVGLGLVALLEALL